MARELASLAGIDGDSPPFRLCQKAKRLGTWEEGKHTAPALQLQKRPARIESVRTGDAPFELELEDG